MVRQSILTPQEAASELVLCPLQRVLALDVAKNCTRCEARASYQIPEIDVPTKHLRRWHPPLFLRLKSQQCR